MKIIKVFSLFFALTQPLHASSWQYFADQDFGIRNDHYGRGDFSAPRGGWTRKHTGTDYLLDYETPLYSPCSGEAKWSNSKAYGYSIDIVCSSPFESQSLSSYYFSIRFAHVSRDSIFVRSSKSNIFYRVNEGESLALVGNSGNAKGTKPHVHLEISVHNSKKEAKQSQHLLKDGKISDSTSQFLNEMTNVCPLAAKNRLRRTLALDNRIDPYILFGCLDLIPAPTLRHDLQEDELYPQHYKWQKHYRLVP